jgi:phosphoribosylamine--glycine ligase
MTPEITARVVDEIIDHTVAGLAADGCPFTGFLYAGLMIDASGAAKALEFNVRLGDPETQPILMRLDSDLVAFIEAALAGHLNQVTATWKSQAALGVVMATGGYPGPYTKGDVIRGIGQAEASGALVFHAGTRLDENACVRTEGGRVLCVCALGANVATAQARAYAGVHQIDWPNARYRRDIGHRAIGRDG